jgi:hypothetical protein
MEAPLSPLTEDEILWLIRAVGNGGKLTLEPAEASDPSVLSLLRGGYLYARTSAEDERLTYQISFEGAQAVGFR